jgi:Domain of unknown function (DUF5680)
MNNEQLTGFLHQASLPHALGTSNAKKLADGSTRITVRRGDWHFHDNFFGGEPYGGRAVISYKDQPVWLMVYYGRIQHTRLAAKHVHAFLRLALQHAPLDRPFRGPDHFEQSGFTYRNKVTGSIENFSGKELILEHGKQIYWAKYLGGLIDQRPGVGF